MEYAIVVLAWILGGFVNNVTGMGGAIVAMPIMTLLLPINIAIPVSCICGFIICIYLSVTHIKHVNYRALLPFVVGCIPGAFLGVFVLLRVPADVLQISIGLFLILYCLWQYFSKYMTKHEENAFLALLTGFFSGVSNSSISFGGPPVYAYSIYTGWDRNQAIGTNSVFYCLLSVVTIYKQAEAGIFSQGEIGYAFAAVFGMGIGVLLSLPVIKKINNRSYRNLLIITIFASGFVCILQGIF